MYISPSVFPTLELLVIILFQEIHWILVPWVKFATFKKLFPCITKTNIRRLLMTVARWQYMDHTRFFLPGVRPFGLQTNPFNDNHLLCFILQALAKPTQYCCLEAWNPRAHLFACRYVLLLCSLIELVFIPMPQGFLQCCFGL